MSTSKSPPLSDDQNPNGPFRARSGSRLGEIGFLVKRQRGSHIILRRGNPPARVVVPDHKNLRVGTLRTILNTAGLTVEELLKLI